MRSSSKTPPFSLYSLLFLGSSVLAALGASAACGDDEAILRDRLPGSGDGSADGAGEGGPTCGLTLPDGYSSPTFETNAAEELRLRKAFDDFLAPMNTVEAQAADGGTPTPITRALLDPLYAGGNPSIQATTTTYYRERVNGWLAAYETALKDGTYVPDVPDGGDNGGVFGGFVFDPTGVDLRQVIEKGTISAAFYNQAQSVIASGAITVGTIDRLIAAFGAHPSFPNSPSAGQNRDVNAAANAARRDSKLASDPGPYQRIRAAMITAKAAVEAGERCNADRDAALKTFLVQWERSNYATVIHDLQDIVAKLAAPDAAVFRTFGEVVGLVAGFKTIPQERRIISDAQIDGLLQKLFVADGAPPEAYKLKTSSIEAASRLQQAITDIQQVYGFSSAELEGFKQNF
jgi:hypothetical protein